MLHWSLGESKAFSDRVKTQSKAMRIQYTPIGIVHSPLREHNRAPIQAVAASKIEAVVEVFLGFAAGLRDIEGFSHVVLVYHFHLGRVG